MLAHPFSSGVWISIALAGLAHAHHAVYHPAMYCFNGTDPSANPNNNDLPSHPLYQMKYSDYWIHAFDGCDKYPPDDGVFLEFPAGSSITVEMAGNRHFTSSNPGAILTPWGDGQNHPDDYSITNLGGLQPSDSGCIPSPNIHTRNESMAAGSAFAISYVSSLSDVTPENLVVFTVRKNTPWKRLTTYDVPSGMPACPEPGGCICVWAWIANGCGERNIFLHPYKCKVTPDSTPAKTIGAPAPAVWCEDDQSKCVKGPKQVLIYDQLEKNNIVVEGYDLSGELKTPGYNMKCGFADGAQNDIFANANVLAAPSTNTTSSLPTGSGTSALPSATPTSSLPAALLASVPASSLPVGSGTSTGPNSPTGSSTPTSSPGACKRSIGDISGAGNAARSKHMKMRRERKDIF